MCSMCLLCSNLLLNSDLILNFDFKDVLLDISPLEQALYITPIKQNNIDSFIETLDPKYFTKSATKQTVKNFIESNV